VSRERILAFNCAFIFAFTGAPASALAGPVVGGVVARPSAVLPSGAVDAFEAGVDEAPGGRARRIGAAAPAGGRFDEGEAALKLGEQKYLEVELKAAKAALTTAVDVFLDEPTDLIDARPATRAVLRLAQVCVALKRRKEADRVLERALLALPRFPAGTSPPPDLRGRIETARRRLRHQFGATLRITSARSGASVLVNGVALGVTPLEVDGLARRPVRVTVTPPGGAPESRLVDLAGGAAEVQVVSASATVDQLRTSIARGDAEAGWTAAARLQASFQADSTCLAVVDEEAVVVARLDATRRAVVGAHSASPPSDASGWRALGRFCSTGAASNLAPAEVIEALWPSAVEASAGGRFTRSAAGFTLAGLGVASWGAATWFALAAFEADDRFSAAGAQSDKDEAKNNALVADIAIGSGVLLVGTGVYLLLTDSD